MSQQLRITIATIAIAAATAAIAQQALLPQAEAPPVRQANMDPEPLAAPTPDQRLGIAKLDGLPQVGQRIDPDALHRIKRPGLYGVGTSVDGSSNYGILEGRLIRYDPDTLRVQSVIREVDQILD